MAPTRKDHLAACPGAGSQGPLRELRTRPVTEVESLDELLSDCLPSFGGGYLRRIWGLLDEAVGEGLPLTMAVAGPVTVSGQHFAWLNPLLDTGWFCLVSTTDAVCYHDGHRALDGAAEHPFHEVAIFGDDAGLRDERTIRVTDVGFDEDVLLDQDRDLRALLRLPEFQRRMTGPEFRHLLGQHYARPRGPARARGDPDRAADARRRRHGRPDARPRAAALGAAQAARGSARSAIRRPRSAHSPTRSIGFVAKSSQPAVRQRSRSPAIECAVRATIGPV